MSNDALEPERDVRVREVRRERSGGAAWAALALVAIVAILALVYIFIQNNNKTEEDKFKQFSDLKADAQGVDLLKQMLIFNPNKRISVDDALKHPYLADFHDPDDEPVRAPVNPVEFEFEYVTLNKEQIKDLIYEEILLYHFKEKEEEYNKSLAEGKSMIQHILGNANKAYDQYEKEDEKNIEAEQT